MSIHRPTKKKFDQLIEQSLRRGRMTLQDAFIIEAAHSVAVVGHLLQTRETGEKFIEHPERAAILAMENGFGEVRYVVTIILHDLPEDAPFHVDLKRMPRLRQVVTPEIYHSLKCLSRIRWDEVPSARKMKTVDEYYGEMGDDELTWIAKGFDRLDNICTLERWPVDQMVAYLDETERYILPKVLLFAPKLGEMINERIRFIRGAITRGIAPRRETPSARSYVPKSMIEGVLNSSNKSK